MDLESQMVRLTYDRMVWKYREFIRNIFFIYISLGQFSFWCWKATVYLQQNIVQQKLAIYLNE